jgi:hypothetical protein
MEFPMLKPKPISLIRVEAWGRSAARAREPLAIMAKPNTAVFFKIFILNPFFC